MSKVNTVLIPKNAVEARIRELAANSANVFVTEHAAERMELRGITQVEVLKCLCKGVVMEGPTLDSYRQKGWKVTMELFCAGRSIAVAAKLVEIGGGHIVVITAM